MYIISILVFFMVLTPLDHIILNIQNFEIELILIFFYFCTKLPYNRVASNIENFSMYHF